MFNGVIGVEPYPGRPASRSLEGLENTGEGERPHLRPRNLPSYYSNSAFILILAMHINQKIIYSSLVDVFIPVYHIPTPYDNIISRLLDFTPRIKASRCWVFRKISSSSILGSPHIYNQPLSSCKIPLFYNPHSMFSTISEVI